MKRENKLSKNKTKELTINWVKELLGYFNQVNESVTSVEVKKVHKELFLIRNK